MTVMLRTRSLAKSFTLHLRGGLLMPVLSGVDLDVHAGECVVLSGLSGVGKSTLFAMLAFASNSLLCRVALTETSIDAASFTSLRLASGALILMAVVRLRGGGRPMAGGSWPAAAMLFIYAAGFSFAYRELSAATGALLLFGAVQLTMIGRCVSLLMKYRIVKLLGPLASRTSAFPCGASASPT